MKNNRQINFCHPKLGSTISCNTCCSESYEETNLLSSDNAELRRGFMADRFIKPPVEIQVVFKYPVNLTCILLWPRVGQQKSIGFEVMSNFSDGTSAMTERISSCYLLEHEEGVLFFCPRKFGRGKSNYSFADHPNFARRPFTWQKMPAISDVKSIVIRIVRTNSSSVPALGKIEIWGQPGFHITGKEKKEIWSLWEQWLNENKLKIQQVSAPDLVAETSRDSTLTTKLLDIPDEFLDALTFEVMSLPMVLPSGKVVDQRTLERHQDSEANWGRPPSDPFTGRPFTANLHPILDTALKSRIDHFLVIHQDAEELRHVPRTLGRKDKTSNTSTTNNAVTTSMQTQKEKSRVLNSLNDKICSTHCQKHNLSQCNLCVNHATASSAVDERKSSKDLLSTSNIKISAEGQSVKRASSPEITILSESILPNKRLKVGDISKSDTRRHQTDDDLDDVLRAALNGLPSFLNVDKTPQSTHESCCNCKSKDNLFKLPCEHLVCRVCLLEKTKSVQLSCYLCSLNFTTDQPIKYHPALSGVVVAKKL